MSSGWQRALTRAGWTTIGIPKPPRLPSLAFLLTEISDASIACAHFEHGYSKEVIGRHIGETRWQVGRRLARFAQ